MKRFLAVAAVMGCLALPATASATTKLSYSKAMRQITGLLHQNFKPGIAAGTVTSKCSRRRSNYVVCSFRLRAATTGAFWCGKGYVRSLPYGAAARYTVATCR
jgi:hypothetical protein